MPATDDWYFIRQAQNHDHITANIHNSRNFQTKQKHSASVPPSTYSGMIHYRQPQSSHSQVILSVLQYRIDYILTPDIPMQHMYRVLWVITRLESDVLLPAMVRNRLPARQRLEKFNYDGAFTFENKTENSPQQNSSICKTFPKNNTFKHHLKTLSFLHSISFQLTYDHRLSTWQILLLLLLSLINYCHRFAQKVVTCQLPVSVLDRHSVRKYAENA